MSESQSTQGPTQQTPLVVTVPTPAQAKQPSQSVQRRRQPAWWSKPPVLVTGALLVLVVELAAYAGLGLLWWAVANAVGLALLFGVLVVRRRGQGGGGLLGRLRPGAARAGGLAARSRLPGLPRLGGGGRGGAVGGSRGSAGGGGLRSRLPRLFGGAGRQQSGSAGGRAGGTGGGAGGGGRATGRRGLAGLLRGGRRDGGGSPAGGSTSGGRSGRFGLRNPLRGRSGRAGGSPAGGAGRASGRTGGRGLGLLGRGGRTGSPSAGGAGRGRSGRGSGTLSNSATGRRGPSKLNPLAWKSWRPGDVGKAPANRATTAKPAGGKPSPKPDGDQAAKPSMAQKPESTDKRPAAQQRQAAEQRPAPKPVPVPKPRHAAAPTPGGAMTLSHSDDQSLQRWGRNLSNAEQAAEEVRKAYAQAEAAAAQYREVMEKINAQYQTEMPASGRLAAELDTVVSRARRASTADEWAAVVTEASGLPTSYKREHETDEDRLEAPRGSRAAEKRADVSSAEQDV